MVDLIWGLGRMGDRGRGFGPCLGNRRGRGHRVRGLGRMGDRGRGFGPCLGNRRGLGRGLGRGPNCCQGWERGGSKDRQMSISKRQKWKWRPASGSASGAQSGPWSGLGSGSWLWSRCGLQSRSVSGKQLRYRSRVTPDSGVMVYLEKENEDAAKISYTRRTYLDCSG